MTRELDGIRILDPSDGDRRPGRASSLREIISAADTGRRWRLGEVIAEPDEGVATHIHPGEPEAIIVLEGDLELHGAAGVAWLSPGDVVFIPPDTEHGLRTPTGGRWLAIWPTSQRIPGPRYRGEPMPDRTPSQEATVATMIDIAEGMAAQTMRIARRDVVEVGDVRLSAEQAARLDEALLHIEQAAWDLRRLRGGTKGR